MYFSASQFFAFTALVASAVAAPASHNPKPYKPYQPFPLSDGFPNPNPAQLKQIEIAAGGSLPNGGLPTHLTESAAITFQLIALNEIFEVAYFNNLITNITSNVPGYTGKCKGGNPQAALPSLKAIRAQEELHAVGANAILQSAGYDAIQPCSYKFPVNNFDSAIALANTFTDVVLSVLPLAQVTFAQDGGDETGLVQLVGSISGGEAEQNGWFRVLGGKTASAAPFLTTSNPSFAFTALKSFIVPGSCPNIEDLEAAIPTFEPLNVVGSPAPKDSKVTFSISGPVDSSANSIVYLSGQNVPVTVAIRNVCVKKGVTYFDADLPFISEGFAKGLTVAALVNGTSTFPDAAAVASATINGPGLLEIA